MSCHLSSTVSSTPIELPSTGDDTVMRQLFGMKEVVWSSVISEALDYHDSVKDYITNLCKGVREVDNDKVEHGKMSASYTPYEIHQHMLDDVLFRETYQL